MEKKKQPLPTNWKCDLTSSLSKHLHLDLQNLISDDLQRLGSHPGAVIQRYPPLTVTFEEAATFRLSDCLKIEKKTTGRISDPHRKVQ